MTSSLFIILEAGGRGMEVIHHTKPNPQFCKGDGLPAAYE
jgi:hypothetical protein